MADLFGGETRWFTNDVVHISRNNKFLDNIRKGHLKVCEEPRILWISDDYACLNEDIDQGHEYMAKSKEDVVMIEIRDLLAINIPMPAHFCFDTIIIEYMKDSLPMVDVFLTKTAFKDVFVANVRSHIELKNADCIYVPIRSAEKFENSYQPLPSRRAQETRLSPDGLVNEATFGILESLSIVTKVAREMFVPEGIKKKSKDQIQYIKIPDAYIPECSWKYEYFTESDMEKYKNEDGSFTMIRELKQEIFSKSLTLELRKKLWPYILGIYDWNCSLKDVKKRKEELIDSYNKIREDLSSVSKDSDSYTAFADNQHRIIKDVVRTDRFENYYASHHEISCVNRFEKPVEIDLTHEKLNMMKNILLTYSHYNTALGYIQGMSDLVSPILYVVDDEVEAFWCFVNYMKTMCLHFQEDGNFIGKTLIRLEKLILLLIPDLHYFLSQRNLLNLFFCYRWIFINFKREFNFEDIQRLWECNWVFNSSRNVFTLFAAVAILDIYKKDITSMNDFDDVLDFINHLSMKLHLDNIHMAAERFYYKFRYLIQFTHDEDLTSIHI